MKGDAEMKLYSTNECTKRRQCSSAVLDVTQRVNQSPTAVVPVMDVSGFSAECSACFSAVLLFIEYCFFFFFLNTVLSLLPLL